ncbi:MAG: hypothetical protein ACREGA_02415 [Candidatus Saccharimonadales bacterium]
MKFGKELQSELASLSPEDRHSRISLRRHVAVGIAATVAAAGSWVGVTAASNNANYQLGQELSQPFNRLSNEIQAGEIVNSNELVVIGEVKVGESTAYQTALRVAKPSDTAIVAGIIHDQYPEGVSGGDDYYLPRADSQSTDSKPAS